MRVNFFATLREIVGAKTVDFPFDHEITAGELLDAIVNRYPLMKKELLDASGRLYGHVHFFINGRDVRFTQEDLETTLLPDDVISVFPAVGGGM